jgi:hypothetical protein
MKVDDKNWTSALVGAADRLVTRRTVGWRRCGWWKHHGEQWGVIDQSVAVGERGESGEMSEWRQVVVDLGMV